MAGALTATVLMQQVTDSSIELAERQLSATSMELHAIPEAAQHLASMQEQVSQTLLPRFEYLDVDSLGETCVYEYV